MRTTAGQSFTRAFVLIELIVVLGIIAIAFVLYYGHGAKRFQTQKQAACLQNLQMIYAGLQVYATDQNGKFPQVTGAKSSEGPLSLLVPRYTSRSELFICPGSKDKPLRSGESFQNHRISYAFLMGLTNQPASGQWILADELAKPAPHAKGDALFSTNGKTLGNNHDKFGGAIMFLDGHGDVTPPLTAFPILKPAGTTILNPSN